MLFFEAAKGERIWIFSLYCNFTRSRVFILETLETTFSVCLLPRNAAEKELVLQLQLLSDSYRFVLSEITCKLISVLLNHQIWATNYRIVKQIMYILFLIMWTVCLFRAVSLFNWSI